MSDVGPIFEEVAELMEALRDGTIEDAQVARLDQLLAEHPEAVDHFVDRAWLQADLDAKLGARPAPALDLVKPAATRRAKGRLILGMAAAAALLVGVLFSLISRPRAVETPDLSYEGCAVLTHALEARWDASSPAPEVGSVLAKRRLALASGWIQIEFFSGARVIVEGPADLEILSANEALCRAGKLRALVPPQAEGFSVRTSSVKLVDRGTEFGLRIDGEGRSEVHVFQGRVELQSAEGKPAASQDLTLGNAVLIDRAGAAQPIPANPEEFLTLSELGLRSMEEAKGRYARWGAASERLRLDPRVVLYYSFEDAQPWSRELRSQKAERSGLDGAIIGCRWAEGRWQGKRALEFKSPGDRVRFRDAGEYESITLMAWVRVDGLDRPFHGLMLTDGWTSGSVHWQITEKGKLKLGIHGDGRAFDYDTAVLFEAAQLGKWTHLCTVYNRTAREVVHYVDGRRVKQIPLRFDTMLRLGSAELGNWGMPLQAGGSIYSVRNLNGRMDEFALFGQALGDDEIRQLYEIGCPTP